MHILWRNVLTNSKNPIIFTLFLFSASTIMFSQEIPMLSPGYVNTFLYNPSLAGGAYNTKGSFFLAHKNSFSQIGGNPVSGIFSVHVPIKTYNCGVGANVFVNKTNIFQTVYTSLATAYHISFDRYKSLSFGLSTDFYHVGINMSDLNVGSFSASDPDILKYSEGKWVFNFSSGINFQTEIFSIGGTINNLRSTDFLGNSNKLTGYYSAYIKFSIPLYLKRDLLQPIISYRQLPFSKPVGNLGMFYSYNSKNSLDRFNDGYFIGGMFVNTNLQLSFLAGFKILKRLQFTYNYELSGKYQNYIGASHELILIYNIIELSKPDLSNEYHTRYSRKLKFKRFLSKIFNKN